jgi:hypothetical protein
MALLDKNRIPQSLHHLIPIAEQWGINDDYEREEKLSLATETELRVLVSSIDDVSDDDLYGWLEGPEASSPMPSDEYASFTCLTMSIDSAKIKLKKLAMKQQNTIPPGAKTAQKQVPPK